MVVEFGRTGNERKELVKAIGELTETKPQYLGTPSYAYKIGAYTVTREGDLEFDEYQPMESVEWLLENLLERGIAAKQSEKEEPEEETAELNIEMPRDFFTDEAMENLKKIIESKGKLMKKVFNTNDLPIEITDEKVSFPWFSETDPDSTKAYMHFITAICEMAKNQTRITAKEKEVESEKYAFRCFLLRLGFNGAEFKDERKILLRNLDGPAAFPTQEAADAFAAKQKEKKEAIA